MSHIAPLLEEATRVAQMEIAVNNESHLLKPGMFAHIFVVLDEKSNTQVIPTTALVRRNGNEGVFMVKDGESVAHLITIDSGIVTQQKIEVLEPKLDGMVVTLGHHLLEDGGSVLLPQSQDATDLPNGNQTGGRR